MWTLFPASCCKMLQLFSTAYIMEYIMYPRQMKIFSLNTGTKMPVLWKASASSVSNCCSASWSYPSSCLHPSPAHWWRITSSLLVWSQGVLSGRIMNGNSCKLQEKGHWLIPLQCVSCWACQIVQNKSWHVSGVLKDWYFPLDYTS